ncbi:putative gelsolin repeat protein [Aspergillus undulatus]|uniref:putative gelsolin repeat protein n=1 Tax=Aspergillus undulatus TaxID=1810928 RepID=UPI003CCDEF1A
MASTSEAAEGSEDVNDFLQRIRELGEKRDKEDEERTKKLEEEILQGRKERQARRAERARSISPTKGSSPILDPARLSMSSLGHRAAIDPPEQLEPATPRTPVHDTHSAPVSFRNETPPLENSPKGSRLEGTEAGVSPKASPTLRSRAGTLSWQQRPSSRDLSGNRSFFSTSPSREARFRTMSSASTAEPGAPRSPLASLSASRESPSLRQTEGDVTPAQKAPVEEPKAAPVEDTKASEPETDEPTESKQNDHTTTADEQSPPPSRASSSFADSSLGNRLSSVSSVSTATGLGSPLPLSSAQKFEPSSLDKDADNQLTSPLSPLRRSPDRSPERSTSPTKGLGGFVQSAMLRRSDSVSKRWSAQLPSGLNRTNSISSNRNSYAAPSATDTPTTPKLNREGSSLSPQRPTSSHSEATTVGQTKDDERPATPPASNRSESISRPPFALHARSSSTVSIEASGDSNSRPTTPVSRTMDPKRWSPTKSTWLESALNLSESPRHKRQPSQQASWSKERQSRGSVDLSLGRRGSYKEVNPGGLMRTMPLGTHVKKQSLSGIPDVLKTEGSSPTKEKPLNDLSPTKEKSLDTSSPVKEEPTIEARPLSTEASSLTKTKDVEIPPEVSEVPEESPEEAPKPKNVPLALSPASKVNTDVPLPSPREPIRDPLLNRPKPQSPVIDFRANLRKREVVKDQSSEAEPEFKNVFGKLRKAETSNYVAPDELKNNILRGKAALNMTGGPKKTQRVDEFKESLVKQRESMKLNGGSVRRNTIEQGEAPPAAVPEAIMKRRTLTKSSIDKKDLPADLLSSPTKENEAPERSHVRQTSLDPFKDKEPTMAPEPAQSITDVPKSGIDGPSTSEDPALVAPITEPEREDEPSEVPADVESPSTFNTKPQESVEHQDAEDPTEVETEKGLEKPKAEASEPVRPLPPTNTARSASPVKNDVVTKGSLAGRINPALAGLLSRGPPAAPDSSKRAVPVTNSWETTGNSQDPAAAPALIHMTKARARGPKRRPPKAAASAEVSPVARELSVSPKTEQLSFDIDTPATSFTIEQPLANTGSWPLPDQGINVGDASETASLQSPPPVMSFPEKSPDSLPRVPEKDKSPIPASTPSRRPPNLERRVYEADSQESTPSTSKAFTPSQPATSPASPRSGQPRTSFTHYSSPTPSPLRSNFRENQAYPSPRTAGPYNFLTRSRDSSPFRKSLPSPPVPPKAPYASTDQLSSPRSSVSLVPQADESLEGISGFFKTFPRSSDRVDIDPQLMLTDNKNDGSGMRTLKKQIWEITGEGNKQDLPVNQEYILYEGALYLCVHIFEEDGSARSEVQLWCGDDVWGGAVDSALPFARKVARDNSCKLEIISQGKEPARFIQALGGILITRRGSSSRSSSSAIFMLCGRKHLGQMVFDEVDFSPQKLCTGFPFVISAMFGKVYLWKGKGSSAEEIGAARLIGMDLGLTGEFEEVAEGEESDSFYEVFPQHKEAGDYMRSDDWLKKPAHDHYRIRLLRVDHELGQRSFWIRRPGSSSPVIRPNDTVQEIEPFSQKDLSPKGIYILDTFFEIYVIVGDQASNRPAEFASAVVFAHEYGILAASLQDRPFIPKSFISLGGTPETCRSAFRKWTRRPLQQPPQIFPLNAAIDAIRS